VFFYTAEHAQFGFNHDAFGMGSIDNAFCDGDIFFVGVAAGIDHDRAVKTGVDTIVAGFFVAMIKMDSEDRFRVNLISSTDQASEEQFICKASCTFADLDNERCLRIKIAPKETNDLFQIIDVVSPDGIFTIGMFKKFFGCNNDDKLLGMNFFLIIL
jgi:hypothetical protein